MYSCGCSSVCMLCTCGTYLKHYITFLILYINVVFVAILKLRELHASKQFTEVFVLVWKFSRVVSC